MARKFPDLADGDEGLDAVQTGALEIIDEERSKIEQMMNDIAGVTTGEVIYWLHRAAEKNKSLHGTFIKRYPRDTPYIDIFEEARDKYGGGDFVLVAQKDGVLFKKAAFSTEKPIVVEKVTPPTPPDPFAGLAQSMEKALVIDRAANLMERGKPVEAPKGADPTVALLTTVLTGMMAQNTALLQGVMQQRKEPAGDSNALMEAIKLGSALAGGKVPLGEEEPGGIMDIIKSLGPYVPQIIASLTGRGSAPPAAQPANRQMTPANRTMIPGVPSVPLPAVVEVPQRPANPEDARAVVMRRIVDEIRFSLQLPPTPKIYDHIIDYIDAYMPEIIRQAEVIEGETFAAYVVTLDPAFTDHKQFFLDLHKHLLESMGEAELIEGIVKPDSKAG
jgi:hypothetical protein